MIMMMSWFTMWIKAKRQVKMIVKWIEALIIEGGLPFALKGEAKICYLCHDLALRLLRCGQYGVTETGQKQ